MPIVRRSTPIMANSASSEVVLHSKYALFLFSGIRQNKGIAIGTGKQDMVFVYLGFTRPVQLFKLGFTEGKEGFLWHFLQGWWYRTLVDAKVFEIKKACGNDKEKIRRHLKDNYGIEL